MSFFIFTYFLGTQSDEFVFPLELRASMFSSQTDSFLRSFARGPRKADPHSRVYTPPKDNAIIHYFASTAQGVKCKFLKIFHPRISPIAPNLPQSQPFSTSNASPLSTLRTAAKTPQTLDFIDYRGVCPQFLGERGMGNVTAPCGGLRPMGKQTRRAKRVPRERAEKNFRPPQSPAPRALPHPRAPSRAVASPPRVGATNDTITPFAIRNCIWQLASRGKIAGNVSIVRRVVF